MFKLEWTLMARDRAMLIVLGVFTLAVVAASLVGGHNTRVFTDGLERSVRENANRQAAVISELRELIANDTPPRARDPRDPLWMGQSGLAPMIMLPSRPLVSVAVGQRTLLPQAMVVDTSAHLSEARETETPMNAPTQLLTGAFDLAFLFVVLFPLVVIGLSYELLSGERARGTLAMLMSQPISQLSLVLGKALARALALCGLTLLFMAVALLLTGVDLLTDGSMLDLSLLAATLLGWTLLWFALSVFVNSFGLDSAANALLLVGVWLMFVVILPGLSHVAVEAVYEAPSGVHLMHESREATQAIKSKLDGMVGTHEKKSKSDDFAIQLVDVEERLSEKTKPLREATQREQEARRALRGYLSFSSPAMLMQNALEEIAGSGVSRHAHFEAQVEAFHTRYKAHFAGLVRQRKRMSVDALGTVPKFLYESEPKAAVSGRVLKIFGVFVLLTIGLVAFAVPRLRKVGRLTR
ncbi:MAG: ABC transporter permease subunit [Bradymonadia bacterium]